MDCDYRFWWNWWVNLAVAVGTLLTVFVALFGETLRAKWFGPALKLKLLRDEGEKAPLVGLNQGVEESLGDSRYYHLHVWNERRWSPAEGAQVYLISIAEPGPSGDFQIVWLGDVPMRWRHQETLPFLRTIGAAADCDLCRVEKAGKIFLFMPLIVPTNLPVTKRGAFTLVASLQVRSNQADSQVLRIRISWDGLWEDGDREMRRHLEIKPV